MKINLSKIKRCNQVWEGMTPNDSGRLCEKCNKTIIDFRRLSDNEVAEIHIFSEEPVCGLYTKQQLKAPERETAKRGKWKSISLGLIGLFYTGNLSGQELSDTTKIVQTEKGYEKERVKIQTNNTQAKRPFQDSIIISGKLIDTLNRSIIGGTIVIKGTSKGTVTNFDGYYSIDVTNEFSEASKITLVFSYTGFGTQEIIIGKTQIENNGHKEVKMKLTESAELIQFVVTRLPLHKRIWYGFKRIFRRKN